MRKFVVYILALITSTQTFAQNYNLIPNSSFEFFEQNSLADSIFNEINKCWITANDYPFFIRNEVDLDNLCFPKPHTGNSYITSVNFFPGYNPNINSFLIDTIVDGISYDTLDNSIIYSMYPETKLLDPLIAGQQYFFSMYVGATKITDFQNANDCYLGIYKFIPNIGVYFSTDKFLEYGSRRIHLTPQLNFTLWDVPENIFTYVKLSGVYMAQGGEQYLTVGNFNYFSDFNMSHVLPDFGFDGSLLELTVNYNAYQLFIDDLTLTSDTINPIISPNYFELGNDTSICEGESIILGGEPNFYGYSWNTGDTSRFITVGETGTYYCTVDFGCANYTDTIKVTKIEIPQTFSLGADTTICNNDTMILAAPSGFNYIWSNGLQSQTIEVTEAGIYSCTINNPCSTAQSSSINVEVNYPPPIAQVLQGSLNVCNNGELITTTLFTNSTYNLLWIDGSSNQSITVQKSGWYWLKETNECGKNIDSVYVVGCLGIESMPNVFSPNGDGFNETFKPSIQDINEIENYNLKIFNRYGQLLFTSENALVGWDGKNYNTGTYYFICTYKEKEKLYKTVSGYLELLR
jgi:gliding motility-associated-like protein